MKKTPKYKYFFSIADVIVIFLSFVISIYLLRMDEHLSFVDFLSVSQPILFICLLLSFIFLFIFQFNSLYRINVILTRASHFTGIIKALYYGALNIVLVSFLIKSSNIIDSRLIIFTFLLIALPFLYLVRVELLRGLYIRLKNNQFKRNVVIIGDGKAGKLLATKLLFENPIGLEIIGFVDDDKEVAEEIVSGKKVLGRISEIREIIKEHNIDEILVAIDNDGYDKLLETLDLCKTLNVTVRLTSEMFDIVARKVSTEKYADIPVLDVAPHYNNSLTLGMKRASDILASIIGLIILSPLFIMLTLIIKTTSAGPVFFSQTRIGRNGKPFKFYKFRSMTVCKGEDEERMKKMLEFMKNGDSAAEGSKIINTNRITWIGKFIRKTSLDELPQLFNVVKGDMSLVGPRPCLPYEYENYDEWQKRRVSVIPGCTGVWQVWGRSSVSFKDSVVLDLYYINNMSPWFDLQLILQTIPTMFFSRGGK
ncbi:MAG: sugar transferase [Ignavibacteriales bacterium]|nr:MAG: sugar transferase [Ignavibacteriales bacterium]